MKKLLLHTCCACCAAYVADLLSKDYEVVMFFSNSNIWPLEEYEKRLNNARIVGKELNVRLIEDKYDNDAWMKSVNGLENEPEGGRRCEICFRFNLSRAKEYAEKNNYDFFATTLTISPHKNPKIINQIGVSLSSKYLESDFKKRDGFMKSINLSKKLNLYRQNYCGCRYSFSRSRIC